MSVEAFFGDIYNVKIKRKNGYSAINLLTWLAQLLQKNELGERRRHKNKLKIKI